MIVDEGIWRLLFDGATKRFNGRQVSKETYIKYLMNVYFKIIMHWNALKKSRYHREMYADIKRLVADEGLKIQDATRRTLKDREEDFERILDEVQNTSDWEFELEGSASEEDIADDEEEQENPSEEEQNASENEGDSEIEITSDTELERDEKSGWISIP